MEIDGNVLTQSVSDWILFSCVLSYNPSNPNILNKCASAVTKVLNYYRFVSRVVPLSDQLNIQDHAVSGVSHNALLEDRMRLGCSTGALCNNNPRPSKPPVQSNVCPMQLSSRLQHTSTHEDSDTKKSIVWVSVSRDHKTHLHRLYSTSNYLGHSPDLGKQSNMYLSLFLLSSCFIPAGVWVDHLGAQGTVVPWCHQDTQ